jgi:hypothetical protein
MIGHKVCHIFKQTNKKRKLENFVYRKQSKTLILKQKYNIMTQKKEKTYYITQNKPPHLFPSKIPARH